MDKVNDCISKTQVLVEDLCVGAAQSCIPMQQLHKRLVLFQHYVEQLATEAHKLKSPSPRSNEEGACSSSSKHQTGAGASKLTTSIKDDLDRSNAKKKQQHEERPDRIEALG